MNQDVSGDNISAEQPKNDYTSPNDEQVKAEAVNPAEPTKAEPEEDAKVEADSEEIAGEGKKPRKGGFQKKIARLEAELAAERAKQPKAETSKFQPDLSTKPTLEAFKDKTWEEYNEALTDWKLEQRDIEKSQKTKTEESKREYQTKAQRFEAQKAEMRERFDDFDERLANYDGPTSQIMDVAIIESEMSGEVLNYLGNHYEDAKKLAGLNEVAAHKFVAKIEAKIESEKSKEKPAVKASNAPPPVKPVGSGKGTATKDPEKMSGDEYLVYERNRVRNLNR